MGQFPLISSSIYLFLFFILTSIVNVRSGPTIPDKLRCSSCLMATFEPGSASKLRVNVYNRSVRSNPASLFSTHFWTLFSSLFLLLCSNDSLVLDLQLSVSIDHMQVMH